MKNRKVFLMHNVFQIREVMCESFAGEFTIWIRWNRNGLGTSERRDPKQQKKRGNKLEKLKIVEEHGVDIIDMTCLWKICATI